MQALMVRLVDAFTDQTFGGNIAGVIADAAGLSDELMQKIAFELAAPTTGFALRLEPDRFLLRFFTPTQEIDMCGHVVLGVCAVLAEEGQLAGDGSQPWSMVAETKAGEIATEINGTGALMHVMMRQNRPSISEVEITPASIAELLGLGQDAIDTRLPLQVASTALRHLVVPLRDAEHLGNLRPDFARLADLSRSLGVETIPVFAVVGNETGIKVRMRDLCPGIGNPEEAASGTTNGALASYLFRQGMIKADANGLVSMTTLQGYEMGRPSRIVSRLRIEDGQVVDVRVGGTAVITLRGEMRLSVAA